MLLLTDANIGGNRMKTGEYWRGFKDGDTYGYHRGRIGMQTVIDEARDQAYKDGQRIEKERIARQPNFSEGYDSGKRVGERQGRTEGYDSGLARGRFEVSDRVKTAYERGIETGRGSLRVIRGQAHAKGFKDGHRAGAATAKVKLVPEAQSYEMGKREGYAEGHTVAKDEVQQKVYITAHRAGYDKAMDELKAQEQAAFNAGFNRGTQEGAPGVVALSQARTEGHNAGKKSGQRMGYVRGHTEGYNSGKENERKGMEGTHRKALSESKARGYDQGKKFGKQQGYAQGHRDGKLAGTRSTNSQRRDAFEDGRVVGARDMQKATRGESSEVQAWKVLKARIDGFQDGYSQAIRNVQTKVGALIGQVK